MTRPQRPMTPYEWALLLLLSLLWGGSFFFVGVAVRELPPLVIVAARVSIAATLLWAMGPLTGLAPGRVAAAIHPLLLLGLLNNAIPFLLIVWGQTRLASGLASVLNASTPVITVVAAHFLTATEKLDAFKILGAVAGLIGVAAMIGPDLAFGSWPDGLAELASLGAALSYALASLYSRGFRALGLTPIDIATGQLTASSVLIVPLALVAYREGLPAWPSDSALGALIGLASLSTALAYILYFRIVAGAGATNVVMVTLLAPATSIALGALRLGERLPPRVFLGLAAIAGGLALIDGRLPRKISSYFAS